MRRCLMLYFLVGILSFSKGYSQQKKYLSPDDYGKWQNISSNDLSPDGSWIAYQVTVQEDNDTFI